MNSKGNKLSNAKIVAITLIGFALAIILCSAILTMFDGFAMKKEIPYLCGTYKPYRELIIIGSCCIIFVLMLLFNLKIKRKWISALVNIVVIVALYNPLTFVFTFIMNTDEICYEIESETDFNMCASDMGIDSSKFPNYNEFNEQNVRFVGKVNAGLFYYQSITAVVKYDNLAVCEADYKSYIDSHQFLTEPVINSSGNYLIAAPEFHYEGIFFKVVTAGKDDWFPKRIYMIGIDRDSSTLYYLYLDDHDLDFVADSNAQDLEGEMREHITNQFNLG